MDKIWLIIQREYLTRVRKKSFIVMTILTPLLMAALVAGPILLAQSTSSQKVVEISDAGNLFEGIAPKSEEIDYKFVTPDAVAAKKDFRASKHKALLLVPAGFQLTSPNGIQILATDNVDMTLKRRIQNAVNNQIEITRLHRAGIDRKTLDEAKSDLDISTVKLGESGEEASNSDIATGAAFVGAFLIYFFIFLYGVQIMRGVIEEKTSRIVEVIISSVKPFQLMMGKVLGIAAVGLTQLVLWMALSYGAITAVTLATGAPSMAQTRMEQVATAGATNEVDAARQKAKVDQVMQGEGPMAALSSLNIPLILGGFVFYFLGGYLLYGALFGAVGSAVDGETDSQQFMMPITIPLIATFIVAQSVIIRDPNGPVAFWMSIFPLTSPIAMVMRLPFGGVPAWQLGLSMVLLIAGFVCTIWIAGRIYRVGILMHGKKVNYQELSKWLFYKG